METMDITTTSAAAPKPGYKLTRFGWIPEEWEVMKLSDVTSKVTVGIASAATHAYRNTGIILLRNLNIKEGYLDTSDLLFIDEEYEHSFRNKRLRVGDILTVRTGYPGISAVVTKEFENAQSFTTLISRPKPSLVDSDYLCYLINSELGKEFVSNGQAGGGQKNINAGTLTHFTFPLPTKSEQTLIVSFLKQWEKYEKGLTDLIEAKHKYKRGLMQQLLTGQRRFPEFQEQPWREMKLGNILQEVSRDIVWDDDELYNLVSVRRRSGGLYFRESLHGHQILTKGLKDVHAGDFLISKMQVVHGALGLATEEFEGMKVSGSYISLVSKSEDELLIEFFNYLSHLPQLYNIALLASHGVHIEKMTFNLRDYFKHSVPIPPSVQEQRKIVQTIEALNQEIELLQAQLRQWQQQKKGLMQQLLTGQLRVPHN
ncbi:restriction endonuclease subunit S [Hymenobacter lucidus]|uniref:Restriction endonuclease subunit S n=1 Tax=Hymenobacter lucidus TaxID=2880930 RepID=A0ABS8AZ50_9BACT|nr:restriction endonuclease subunit S [Hymenobacter lucidus]MCB2411044.1 restriction endonuclease subunit S [Hymenobacter lucidus]